MREGKLPYMPPWSSGLGRLPLTQVTRGSNPPGGAMMRGGAVGQLACLISTRSQVRILPPLPIIAGLVGTWLRLISAA